MTKKLLALALLAGGVMLAGPRVAIGVSLGGPYGYYAPPPPVYYGAPAYADPYYGSGNWVDGYWYYSGPRRLWQAGYWAAPVYRSRFYGGYGYNRGYYRGGYYGGGRGYYRGGGRYSGHGYRR